VKPEERACGTLSLSALYTPKSVGVKKMPK